MFAKLSAQLKLLRQPHSYEGMREYIEYEQKIDPNNHYETHMAMREWQYRIPEKKLEAFNEVYKDYTATIAVAQLYIPEIVTHLLTLEAIRWRVENAAAVLGKIDPRPSIDPTDEMPKPDST